MTKMPLRHTPSFNLLWLSGACCLSLIASMLMSEVWAESRERETSDRPNILLILADDWGFGDFGVFHQKMRERRGDRHHPWHQTPSLDQMAAEGMELPHHYCAAPVCAPSRASLLLGVHQGHANVRDNQFDKALENNHTIPSVLKSAGYATIAIGKYGLQGDSKETPSDWPAHPNRRGFDEFYGYMRHVDGHEHYPLNGLTKGPREVWRNDEEVSSGLDKCYTTDLFTARAKKMIIDHVGDQQKSRQPFFIYLAYDTPHAALTLPTGPYPEGGGVHGGLQWLGEPGQMINTAGGEPDSFYHPDYASATWDHDGDLSTDEVAWPDVQKRYATLVRRIDDCVGDLLQTLSDLQIDQDTLIVFTTDNGPSLESYLPERFDPGFFDGFGPYDGTKRDLWEGGVHVGAIARWPARIPAASTSGELATGQWDWLPTFADAAGLPVPARCDGVSLLPLLTGKDQLQLSTIYVEYAQNGRTPALKEFMPERRNKKRHQMQMLRKGNIVGVRYDIQSADDEFEIYDVVADPRQRRDLASSMPEYQEIFHSEVLRLRRPDSEAARPYDQALVPASKSEEVEAEDPLGIRWAFHSGSFPYVPQLSTMRPKETGASVNSEVTEFRESGAVFCEGMIHADVDGEYTFLFQGNTRAVARLHQATLIDADAGYAGQPVRQSIHLAAGDHPISIIILTTSAKEDSWKLSYQSPSGAETLVAGSVSD